MGRAALGEHRGLGTTANAAQRDGERVSESFQKEMATGLGLKDALKKIRETKQGDALVDCRAYCRCQRRKCKRRGFDPWVRKIPWRRKWQAAPVFLPGKFSGQRSLVGYSPWGKCQ